MARVSGLESRVPRPGADLSHSTCSLGQIFVDRSPLVCRIPPISQAVSRRDSRQDFSFSRRARGDNAQHDIEGHFIGKLFRRPELALKLRQRFPYVC
jgi:hypothetical protein